MSANSRTQRGTTCVLSTTFVVFDNHVGFRSITQPMTCDAIRTPCGQDITATSWLYREKKATTFTPFGTRRYCEPIIFRFYILGHKLETVPLKLWRYSGFDGSEWIPPIDGAFMTRDSPRLDLSPQQTTVHLASLIHLLSSVDVTLFQPLRRGVPTLFSGTVLQLQDLGRKSTTGNAFMWTCKPERLPSFVL
jgi:hypothetical protein